MGRRVRKGVVCEVGSVVESLDRWEIHTDTHRYTQIHSVSGPVLDTHQIHTWIHTRYTHKAGRLRLVSWNLLSYIYIYYEVHSWPFVICILPLFAIGVVYLRVSECI